MGYDRKVVGLKSKLQGKVKVNSIRYRAGEGKTGETPAVPFPPAPPPPLRGTSLGGALPPVPADGVGASGSAHLQGYLAHKKQPPPLGRP